MKLSLGTVQFGLNYGINNIHGKPTLDQSVEMLKHAYDGGVNTFDTANAYGNAEEVLGLFIKKYDLKDKVHITSKLKPNIFDDFNGNKSELIEKEIRQSLQILNIDKLDGYLLHSPRYIYDKEILDGLQGAQCKGLINNYGVSIYEPDEALYAVKNTDISYIQIPYNIFDQRLDATDFFEVAKKKNIKIFARTVFIQGLIFMNDNKIPEHVKESKEFLNKFDSIIKKYDFTRGEAAINFVKNHPYIDCLVIGVDDIHQLNQNIEIFNKDIDLNNCFNEIKSSFSNLDTIIFFPSLWSSK